MLGRKTYAYGPIHEVALLPKWYSRFPEICVDRYEPEIRTHRYLYFFGRDVDRIQFELLEGKKRCWLAEQTYIDG